MAEAKRPWRYQLEQQYVRNVPQWTNLELHTPWLSIYGGVLVVPKHYAWDGCTPAWFLPLLGWVSPPQGKKDTQGRPASYFATLVHDALCQFRTDPRLKITQAQVVQLFYDMLIEGGFPKWQAKFYAKMVDWFGPQNWKGNPPVDPLRAPGFGGQPPWNL